jgi:arylsulfatase A-like enzyme
MYPTLVDLCGLRPPPHELDGLSFAPIFDDPATPWKHSAFSVWGIEGVGQRSITTERYNYIETIGNLLRAPAFELFDLQSDPEELQNVHAALPEVAAVMAERLELGPDAALPEAPPITW